MSNCKLVTNKILDVVFVGCVRPSILELTIRSFKHNMLDKHNVRLIVNIDPVGEEKFNQNDILAICEKYFKDITFRTPDRASFSDAVRWCWSQVQSEYFLHLEDDWCLNKKVNLNGLIDVIKKNKLDGLRLNLRRNSSSADSFGCVESDGFSLNPTIFRTVFIKSLIPIFDTTKDPEKQFRNLRNSDIRICYVGKPGESAYVIDTGKKWRKYMGFGKWTASSNQITWLEKQRNLAKHYYFLKYLFFLLIWNVRYRLTI